MTPTTKAHVIAIANCKGGVAKTTTTANLGAALVDRGRKVLLVDLDAQQDLCATLKARIPRPGLADVLLSTAFFGSGILAEAFVTAHGMTVAGGYGIANAERELARFGNAADALGRALEPYLPRFDYVLLDCAPSSNCLTTNALAAARDVLVPIQTEFLAANQLPSIMSVVDEVRSKLNSRLKVCGFLPTMYDGRSNHALAVMEHIALQAHMWGVRAFQPIPRAVRLAEASEAGTPISRYAGDSPPARAYAALAEELDRDRDMRLRLAAFGHSVSPVSVGSYA
jgi:chromosome partitioning protein